MTPLSCAAARRRLQAFHDRELDVPDQIAVGAHVEWCDECADALAELGAMRSALQHFATRRTVLTNEQASVFNASVVSRLKAEEDASFLTHVRGLFDDMHFVYAGLGAAAAALLCVVILLGMMRFAAKEEPDSLAALVSVMAIPVECEPGLDWIEGSGCARWVERVQRANESAERDAVFTLAEVVTRHGRLTNFAMLRAGRRATIDQLEEIEGLLDVVSRSRLDSGQPQRLPAAFLVARETVRAIKPLDVPLPAKKRAEAGSRRPSRVLFS
jgi:hypothetical protein